MIENQKHLRRKLLLSRLLTRSGDQAWDFALPLALIIIFPKNIALGIGLFFLSKLLYTFLAPIVGDRIDEWSAKKILQRGIGLQTIAVVAGGTLIWTLYLNSQEGAINTQYGNLPLVLWFIALTISMVMGALGAMVIDIFISQILVPDFFKDELTKINAYIRQIDLGTEVGSPVVTGIVIAACASFHPLAGFSVVVLWNALSFIPEYFLVKSCCETVSFANKKLPIPLSMLQKYRAGFRAFFKHKLTVPILAYTMLWFSVLSPHGVLLTTFLKGGWNIPEQDLGIFRGLGAVFGVSATLMFPFLVKKFKLIGAAGGLIVLQATAVSIAAAAYMTNSSHWYFFSAILISRIGLYGFSQGEMELRQRWCADGEKGQINGFASAMNNSATLLLLLAGTFFTNPDDFVILVVGSAFFVCLGAVMFLMWAWQHRHEKLSSGVPL
jgi:iron-regulated transporter 1